MKTRVFLLVFFSFVSLFSIAQTPPRKPKFCPNLEAMFYILMGDVDINSTPIKSKLDDKYKEVFCKVTECVSFCSEASDTIKSEWIVTRNKCRAGEVNQCRELIRTLSENFTMKPNIFCKNSDLTNCEPTETTLCLIVGGDACYSAIKKERIHDTETMVTRNAACKSGVLDACEDLNKYIKDSNHRLLQMCHQNFTVSCVELMESMIKDGKKDSAIELGVSFCQDSKSHWGCVEFFEKSAPELAAMVLVKLKALCTSKNASDECLGYALQLKKSDPVQALSMLEKICDQSSIDHFTPGYYSCWEVFETYRAKNKVREASLLVDKLCLYQTKIDVFFRMDCQAKKMLKLSQSGPDQKASSASCAHNGTKDFLDELGNPKLRLTCKGGLRDGLSEFDRTLAGDVYDVMSQEVEYRKGVAHGRVRVGHYSTRYKVEYSIQDGVLEGMMRHLNGNDRFSRGKKLASQFKDGVYDGVSFEENSKTVTYKNGFVVRTGADANLARDCKSSESQIQSSDFTELRTIKSCTWPHKADTIYDNTAGLATDRRRVLANRSIEISKFKDGFVIETLICNRLSQMEKWKKYTFGGWKTSNNNETKPYYKIWDVPYKDGKVEGLVTYYSHGKSSEQIRFENGVPNTATRVVESIRCAR